MTAPTASEALECQSIGYTHSTRSKGVFASVAFITGLIAFISTVTLFEQGQPVGLIGLLPLAATLAAMWWRKRREQLGDGVVSLDDEALHVRGAEQTLAIYRDDIAWGAHRDAAVDIETKRGRRLSFTAPDAAAASALLEASGTSVDQRTLTLPLRAPIGPFVSGLLMFMGLQLPVGMLSVAIATALAGGSGAAMGLAVTPILSILLAWQLVKLVAKPTISIGIDGVTVRRRLSRRFIPYDEVRSVEHKPGAADDPNQRLRLVLRDETIDLPVVTWHAADFERVQQRIQQAHAARVPGDGASASAFARQGLDVAAWQERLRRQLSADPSFRRRRITTEDAEGVLADANEAIEHRMGAALALREVDADGAGKRIRFAADASADPRVRIALLSTLEDEAEAQAALDAVEAQADRARR